MNIELKLILDKFKSGEGIPPLLVDNKDICEIINYLNDTNILSIHEIENEYMQNIFLFKTEDKSFKIELAREIIEKANIRSSGDFNIFVIEEIDKFTDQTANSFLKLFEDVPDGILFLLTTNSKENLLETISSRILFFSKNSNIHEIDVEIKDKIDRFFSGDKNDLIKFLYSSKIEKHEYIAILEYLKEKYKRIPLNDTKILDIIEESAKNIYSTNANPKWILDKVLLNL
ncbi:MAG: hypothetical protein PHS92_01535 [Candidatus Gracilibacteria bacterium]|nr:hypothetical protein [Candidatus Gracilibacteria bacterium]